MKTRQLIRKHGWTAIDLPKTTNDSGKEWWVYDYDSANNQHYSEVMLWCNNVVGKENFVCTLQDGTGRHGIKRFVFKHAKHATLFTLKWV